MLNIVLEVLASEIKKEKEIKGISIRKEEIKIFLFVDDMIMSIKSQNKKEELRAWSQKSCWVPWSVMEGAASPGHSGPLCGPHLCGELWHLNLTLASALELLVTSASTLPLEPLQELGLICRSGVGAAQVHRALWLGQRGGVVCEGRGFYGRTFYRQL